MPTAPLSGRCLAALLGCGLAATSLAAQSRPKPLAAPDRGWQFNPAFRTDAEFDNNVFLLSDLKKGQLAPGAPAGTRYADMVSASDVITTFRAHLGFDGPGIGSRKMKIVPEVRYDFYAQNVERRGATYAIALAQATTRGGLVRLKAEMQPQRFFKDYLVDAIDRDGDGVISSGEKLYAGDKRGETTVDGDYTMRLTGDASRSALGAALRLAGGWYTRTNNTSFASHDLKGPTAGAKLLLNTPGGSHIDLGYSWASLVAPRMNTVMLINETQYNRDFNNNGNATDVDVRTIQMVNRSRMEQELGAAFGTELGAAELAVEYAYRTRRFTSAELYDAVNNGRRDARNEFGGTLRYKLTNALRLRAAALRGAQTLNRAIATAATGEVADYNRMRTSVGLEYRF